MKCVTVDTHIKNRASSQYVGYDFNSMVMFNGQAIGANGEGLFTLEGDTDTGEQISAEFEIATTDFGMENEKRLRKAYIGMTCSGEMILRTKNDGINPRDYTVPGKRSGKQGNRVSIGRDGRGRFWSVRLKNKAGSDFSVWSIKLLPIVKPNGLY